MKVCIKENELNWNYHEVFGEEKAIQDGYRVFEIPKGYEDCAYEDFDINGFNIELYRERKRVYSNQTRLGDLISWFENYFDKQLTQSQWQDDFIVSHDDYFDKDYENIDELKAQAKIVRDEIRRLRQN